MTQPEKTNIEKIARTISRGHEIRRSEEGIFIRPSALDHDGELHLSLEELGQGLRLIGWNSADLFPDG